MRLIPAHGATIDLADRDMPENYDPNRKLKNFQMRALDHRDET